MSAAADLGGSLLASVSRSFYLTIRLLPQMLREPIGLAYLLARASDTIADSTTAPAEVRLRQLAEFATMIRSGETTGLELLQREISPEHAGERELIARLEQCLAWLAAVPAADRAEITAVLEKIIRGQTLDLDRFAAADRITALSTAAELEEYTYLVAGCVGEFWTRICAGHLQRYATLDLLEMCRLGRSFGQGLQLVNILRDLPSDLREGRCYLPADELQEAGTSPENLLASPAAARPVVARWLEQARAHLDDGCRYIEAVRPARLRAAVFLPWYLGVETLRLLERQSPLESAVKIKVSRGTVRTALWRAVAVAFSNRALVARW